MTTITAAPASPATTSPAPARSAADTVVDLFRQPLRFAPGGSIEAIGPSRATPDPGWVLATAYAESNADVHADHWERHPGGDEVVGCLRGSVRLVLRGDARRPDAVLALDPGAAAVVPRGRWHRLEVDEPTELLVTTIRAGTELEPVGAPAA
jgi:mannose-6-phosphate isomerase-like protein (cupin superfamily)